MTTNDAEFVNLEKHVTWEDVELKVWVLRLLLAARKRDPANGGATVAILNRDLVYVDAEEIASIVDWLKRQGFVETLTDEQMFLITVAGVDFIYDQLPPDTRPERNKARQPGWWPPPAPPDDMAGIRKRPYPVDGSGEISLPLPPPDVDL